MKLFKAQSRPSEKGPKDWFIGTVWLDEIAVAEEPSRLRIHSVTFEPAARTAWHRHPVGQVLHISSGVGWVQKEGDKALRVQAGDTVWIAPNEKHWHGAAFNHLFVHLAVQEATANGTEATWYEHVSDRHYRDLHTDRG